MERMNEQKAHVVRSLMLAHIERVLCSLIQSTSKPLSYFGNDVLFPDHLSCKICIQRPDCKWSVAVATRSEVSVRCDMNCPTDRQFDRSDESAREKLHREPPVGFVPVGTVRIVYIFVSREPRLSGCSLYVHINELNKKLFV